MILMVFIIHSLKRTLFIQRFPKVKYLQENSSQNKQVASNNNAYYKHVFSEKALQYQVNDSTQDVFTDVNSYSSITNNSEETNRYGGWGENPDNNITVNINTNPWNYNYWGYPYFNWGFNYWNSPFFYDPSTLISTGDFMVDGMEVSTIIGIIPTIYGTLHSTLLITEHLIIELMEGELAPMEILTLITLIEI